MQRNLKDYVEVNQCAYDALASEYNHRVLQKSDFEEDTANLGDPVLKYAKQHYQDITALEVGPGSGEMLAYFEEKGCRTIAVELSGKIAEIAKRRSPNTVFILGNILDIRFSEKQFDVIYAGAVIHLFPLDDALILLDLFYSWLKNEGVLFVNTTIHPMSREGYEAKLDYHTKVTRYRRKWREDELREALERKGFTILERLFTNEKNRAKKWVAYICRKKPGTL